MEKRDLDKALDDFNALVSELERDLDALEASVEGREPAPDADSPEAREWRARMLEDIAAFEARTERFLDEVRDAYKRVPSGETVVGAENPEESQ